MASDTENVDAGSFLKKAQLRLPLSCDPPGPNNPAKQLVWLVFGGTGHMGRSVVKTALAKGDIVTMVGRSQTDSLEAMRFAFSQSTSRTIFSAASKSERMAKATVAPKEGQNSPPTPSSLNNHQKLEQSSSKRTPPSHPSLMCLLCDVRVRSSVAAVLKAHLEHWGDGRLDVVANCTGYGVFGSCEDQDDAELRNQFETNFWGTLNIVQLTLPCLRARRGRGGRYLIFSSTSGALGVPGLGPYCATKYAVEGLVESMLYEVDAFDIRVTLVSPGHVRRDEPEDLESERVRHEAAASKGPQNNTSTSRSTSGQVGRPGTAIANLPLMHLPVYSSFVIKPPSAVYQNPSSPAFHAKRVVQWMADSQPTSVVKAAELVWQLAHCSYPPLRLLLGSFAVESVRDRLRTIMEEIEDWKFLSFGEDIDPERARERVSGKEQSREESDDGEEETMTIQQALMYERQDRRDYLTEQSQQFDELLSDLDDGDDYDLMDE